jgi:hypothetical protein
MWIAPTPELKPLENELGLIAKYLPAQKIARTTDATVTTLLTLIIPVNTVVKVWGQVVARRTGGVAGATNDGAGYTVDFVATNTAGTAAIIGAASVTAIGESQAAWAVTVTFSGGNALVRVTGAAANNVTWIWSGKTLTVED